MIHFACPKCQTALSAPDDKGGSKTNCPRCQQRLQIPMPVTQNKTVLAQAISAPGAALRQPATPGHGVQSQPSPGQMVAPSSPDPKSADWYYGQDGQQVGPVSWAQLRYLTASAVVKPTDPVWTPGMGRWIAARLIQGLFPRTGAHGVAPSGGRKIWLWAGLGTAAAAAVILAIIFLRPGSTSAVPDANKDKNKTRDKLAATKDKKEKSRDKRIITDVENEQDMAGALGMVAVGLIITERGSAPYIRAAGSGTGFAISAQGHVLTNRHVVADIYKMMTDTTALQKLRDEKGVDVKPTIWVFFAGKAYPAKILHISTNFDLSILKVERTHTPFFALTASGKVRRTRRVYACGFPDSSTTAISDVEKAAEESKKKVKTLEVEKLFKTRDFEFVQTAGSVARVITEEGGTRRWIQHDATINPGNSGGPLMSDKGTVLGINTLGVKGRDPRSTAAFYALSVAQLREEIGRFVPQTETVWE